MPHKAETPTHEEFLQQVERHQLSVKLDDGLHRHLQLKEPGNSNRYFGIVTWPGYLAYYGDMGSYSFSRVEDMFTFFRRDMDASIDFHYWSEKLQSVDASCGRSTASDSITEFSRERFEECIGNEFKNYLENRDVLSDDEKSRLWRRITREVLESPDNTGDAIRVAIDFEHDGRQVFPDFYEYSQSITEYTYRFIWCCYAIRWAIHQYDRAKAGAGREVARV